MEPPHVVSYIQKMRADSLRAGADEGLRGFHVAMKREHLFHAVFFNGVAQGNLVGHLPGAHGVAVHQHFAVAQQLVRHHFGSDDGDDDFVIADDAPAGGFGKGQAVGLRAIDGGIVHGKQQPGLAFAVAVVRVVMSWRGGEEQAFADGKILVVEGKGEVPALASGGFVRFIEHGQIKPLPWRAIGSIGLQCVAYDGRGLVGGENHFHAGKGQVQKTPHARGVGGDFKVEVGLLRGERVKAFLHGRVGADAEIGERWQTGFAQPFVQGLAQQRERGEQDENFGRSASCPNSQHFAIADRVKIIKRRCLVTRCGLGTIRAPGKGNILRDPKCHERFAGAAGHDGGNAVVRLQRWKQGVQCFGLVRLRRFFRRDKGGVGQPGFHRVEVTGFQTIQVRATDAEETLAFVEDGGQFVAVGEQHTAVNARTVGQTDESGEFAPRQRRASGAELDLIGVELAEQSLQHAVHA